MYYSAGIEFGGLMGKSSCKEIETSVNAVEY